MPRRGPHPLLLLLGVVVVALFAARAALPHLMGQRVRALAEARDLDARWHELRPLGLGGAEFLGLALVTRAGGDTVLEARRLAVFVDPGSVVRFAPAPGRIELTGALGRAPARAPADSASTLEPAPRDGAADRAAHPRIRAAFEALVRLMTAPARQLPSLRLTDVRFALPAEEDSSARGVHVDWLNADRSAHGIAIAGSGTLVLQRDVPFEFDARYGGDDRFRGRARFGIPDPARQTLDPLTLALTGRIQQDRAAGALVLSDSTELRVGDIPIRIEGRLARRGPAASLALSADGLTAARLRAGVPPSVLGPLAELDLQGAYDHHVRLEIDLARPDSVRYDADVIPHGLALGAGPLAARLRALGAPFTATIHLPRQRLEVRELREGAPNFLPLGAIDSNLVHAVVTNEDGAFFRHRGFNTEAVRQSIAENLRHGRFRRGAGTITMQLVRNLFLGHERTLSRKAQEVALAWIVEHLTPVPKARLLEIYMNVIEWGPGVHGANEAAWFYFGHDARAMTVDEALFLATLVPSPSKWRWRLDADGALRPSVRAQMHFIGRAMIAKGWLQPEALPPADSLRVELAGPAGDAFRARAAAAAAADSLDGGGEGGDPPADAAHPDAASEAAETRGAP